MRFKGAYESLGYRLQASDNDESCIQMLKSLEEPVRECKLVLECIRERLENTNFVKMYIIGSHFDKKFKKCVERLKDQKELFELMMQADQQVMQREIKKFLQNSEQTIFLIQSTTAETNNKIVDLKDVALSHREESRMHHTKTEDMLEKVHMTILSIHSHTSRKEQEDRDAKRKDIVKWLWKFDFRLEHSKLRESHEKSTGNWFLEGEVYQKWRKTSRCVLWLHGISGCGKSVLCSTIIDETMKYCIEKTNDPPLLAYYYFTFDDREKQRPVSFLRSILAQFISRMPQVPENVHALYNSYSSGEPPLEDLKVILKSILESLTESFIFIDGLDECQTRGDLREQLCDIILEISNWSISGLHISITSRKEQDIYQALSKIQSLIEVPIQNAQVVSDIEVYVESQVVKYARLNTPNEKAEEIKTTLVEKLSGMFRWVSCQIDVLKKCKTRNDVRKTLNSLPNDLNGTYQRILEGIDESDRTRAATALKWLIFVGKGGLTVETLAEASIINPSSETPFDVDDRYDSSWDILEILSSLVTITSSSTENSTLDHKTYARIAHFSVQEYLLSDLITPRLARTFRIQELPSRQMIARSCMYYIEYCSVKYETFTYEQFVEYPIITYCCESWQTHERFLEDTDYASTELVCQFFQNAAWLKLWNAEGRLHIKEITELSPIYLAAEMNLTQVVKKLLDSDLNSITRGRQLSAALEAACNKKNETVVEMLLEKMVEINPQGEADKFVNAFQIACKRTGERVVSLLLEKGAEANRQGGYFGNPLQVATQGENIAVVKLLIEKGAKVNAQGGHFGNALQSACERSNESIVRLLLENGADICASGGHFNSAILAAAFSGRESLVKLLLEKGADVNVEGGHWGSALQAAMFQPHENAVGVVRTLLQHGADINIGGGPRGSAIQMACSMGIVGTVKLLLAKGADINVSGYYKSPLVAASRAHIAAGREEIMQILLKKGAKFDAEGDEQILLAERVKDYATLATLLKRKMGKWDYEWRGEGWVYDEST